MLTRAVYEKGQIVVPKNIRDMVGLHAGSEVVFSVEGDSIILKKHTSVAKEFEAIARGTTGKLEFNRTDATADRMKRMGL